ncbi:hypothetical protein ALC60_02489 [Trachymyrmex zeteki]|uniref:Phospholipase A2-like domain-containing protein n=1 Tax=Mycetomoellerius zeteki TaxID=64791 RepID=A0A151XDS4_9HYME|nr:hypothetical protein ALC60_02489 [Trachymyrmex zeteki]
MYLALYHPFDILHLSAEQLKYIPKVILLRVYGDYIDHVWDKLPEHVKMDSEVRTYRRCNRMSTSRGDLLNRVINALPFELHISGYQFCGPGTRLTKRLARGDTGINPLDAACREHDIAYSRSNDLTNRHAADKVLADKALERITARDSALSERDAAATVWAAMKTKTKIGMGMKPKKKTTRKKVTKKRILPTAKRGGALPILGMLGALGSLIGGAASVVKTVNDSKAARRQLEELQCHDRAMEQGYGLYLAPDKYGRGVYLRVLSHPPCVGGLAVARGLTPGPPMRVSGC